MTAYEQGFLTKCAEYELPYEVAIGLLKRAALFGNEWGKRHPNSVRNFRRSPGWDPRVRSDPPWFGSGSSGREAPAPTPAPAPAPAPAPTPAPAARTPMNDSEFNGHIDNILFGAPKAAPEPAFQADGSLANPSFQDMHASADDTPLRRSLNQFNYVPSGEGGDPFAGQGIPVAQQQNKPVQMGSPQPYINKDHLKMLAKGIDPLNRREKAIAAANEFLSRPVRRPTAVAKEDPEFDRHIADWNNAMAGVDAYYGKSGGPAPATVSGPAPAPVVASVAPPTARARKRPYERRGGLNHH